MARQDGLRSRMLGVKEILRDRVLLVDLLAVLFGISAWISINGLWVELPLLVNEEYGLPEGWALPSYLSIIIQVANIGPISYSLLRNWQGCAPRPHLVIILLLMLGIGASLALALSWKVTFTVADAERSVGLFVCVFFLALVDCTSSVLFLPFMGLYREVYLNSYLVGEGMSGFVPAIAALIQGVGGNSHCVNVTYPNGTTSLEKEKLSPRFSVEDFFYFLLCMMLLSLVAFLLLQYLPTARREMVSSGRSRVETYKRRGSTTSNQSGQAHLAEDERRNEDHEAADGHVVQKNSSKLGGGHKLLLLLVLQAAVCFLSNGFLPSIQSYSCLPYGNLVYHSAATLHAMANPLMAFLAMFLPCRGQRTIWGLSLLGCGMTGFILATALWSPAMLGGQDWGGVTTVLSWVLTGAVFSYAKVCIAGLCRELGALFYCGAATQLGSALGALVAFLLVNEAQVFQGYYGAC